MGTPVQPGSRGAAIVEEEERLFGRVQARVTLGADEPVDHPDASEYDRELVQLRDQIAEAKPEDLAPLVEQMTRLAAIRSRIGGSRTLPVDIQSPYFAHMALREHGKTRDVLVGKRGFIDRKQNVQIVDWRNAPISQVYYRYDEGDDYEEEIAGRRIAGVVQVRRNISIFNGKLRRIGAPQGTYIRDARGVWHEAVGQAAPVLQGGQGKAVRVPVVTRGVPGGPARSGRPGRAGRNGRGARLGVHHGGMHRADKSLPEIAALIDREQFDLITQPESGMVVIQGGAGSGKTTVALHRIAYLNFHDRSRFRADRLLFVVPSRALVTYVSGVLPSLGVRGVPVVTYDSWARNQRRKLVPRSGAASYNEDTPDTVSRVKKHSAMLAVADRFVARQTAACTRELEQIVADAHDPGEARAVTAAPDGVVGADDAALGGALRQWRDSAHLALIPRLSALSAWLREHAAALPARGRIGLQSAVKRWRSVAADALAGWSEMMTDAALLTDAFTDAGAVDRGEISAYDLRRTVSWCGRQAMAEAGEAHEAGKPATRGGGGEAGEPLAALDGRALDEDEPRGRLDHEDEPILLRLIQLRHGQLIAPDGKITSYEHVAIDEAQDRSAIEVAVLCDAVRADTDDPARRSITIAGDTAQRLVFDNDFTSWEALLERTGGAATVRPLKLSYRSTAEVMAFAREVLGPDLAPDEDLVARSGAPVELHAFGDTGEAVAFLADALRALAGREPSASIAIISRHPEQADLYYSGLARAEVPALRRVRRHDFEFQPGVDVTDVTQVKGLEFDYVIMVEINEPSYPATVEARHLLHIGATRAAHQLWLISTDRPSPLLPESMRELAM